MTGLVWIVVAGLIALGASPAAAQGGSATDEIAKYRQQLAEGNPAELWEARGEELWRTRRGPRQTSLQACDLGLGPGVVQGAYAQLPRFFADTAKVQDLESRLVTCMMTLQGLTQAEATAQPFGAGASRRSTMEALAAWITSESRGVTMNVSTAHPKAQEAYEIGKRLFFYRAGPYDFACATCHSADGRRIRLQDLPNLLEPRDAQRAYTSWPAYRVSQSEVRTMQHRLWDCYRQQRFPEPAYASDAITALSMFLAVNANGGVYNAPALKR